MEKPLKPLIDELTECPENQLPVKLRQNLTWERPKSNLFHWIPLLNRFDEVFEHYISEYGLDEEFTKLRVMKPEHADILVSCLQFTYLLLEHCANRSIYSSSDRIFHLLNTATIDVRLHALQVAVMLGERYLQTNSSKYSSPKPVKLKVLELAKFYPLPIPPNFNPRINNHQNKNVDSDDKNKNEHLSLLDTITNKKRYPSKWRLIHFQYFKTEVPPPQAQKETKKKKKSKKESKKDNKSSARDTFQEGLADFTLSEENVRKLSLEQIYDKATEVIPKEFWFEFSLHAQVVKSFNTKSYDSINLREQLLRTKCLAIAFVCCSCPSDFTAPRLFESEPYIFSFLTDFIQPENTDLVSKDVYFAAIKTLECISMRRVWGNDIIRCMGGNVNHGTLFQVIRHINKKVRDEDDDLFERGYGHFFNVLGNLIVFKIATPRLTAGGILNDLMLFLETKSKYRWTCSAALHIMTLYLNAAPESFTDFVSNDGFNKLINTVNYEVDFALENPGFGGGPPKTAVTYYSITLRQSNYIRNLLKLVAHLIQSESGDILRNLFDSSILQSFNKIILNPKVFGPAILSATVDAVFYIIHNEPTAFSILNEANVIDTILDNYDNLFIPSSDLLVSLPEVLGAICLNKEGLDKIIKQETISKYFKSFYVLENAKQLVRSDMSTNLGCCFDELGRHYSSLKPIIMREVVALLQNLFKFSNEKLDCLHFYDSPNGALYLSKDEEPDQKSNHPQDDKEIDAWETSDSVYILDNLFFFLGGLLQDSGQWGNDAIESIKFEVWTAFLTLDYVPFDYTTSNGLSSLMGVLKYFDDEDRTYGFPVLFRIFKSQFQNPLIQDFMSFDNSNVSFFERYNFDPVGGTKFLNELNKLNTLMYTITEIYINQSLLFPDRYVQIATYFGAEGLEVIDYMGAILRKCAQEEIIIRSNVPEIVARKTAPVLDVSNNYVPVQVFTSKPDSQEKEDLSIAKFKNTLQIRFLTYRIQNHIATIFASIGRVCMMRRQDYSQYIFRRRAVNITNKLATVMTEAIDAKVSDSMKENYLLIMANIFSIVILNKERNKYLAQTSLIIALIESGFFSALQDSATHLWNKLLQLDPDEVKSTEKLEYISSQDASITKNALNQILSIFANTTSFDSYPAFPNCDLYYHYGFEKRAETQLLPSVLVEVRIVAIKLLVTCIGGESKLFDLSSKYHPGNIPTAVIEKMISIFKTSWNRNHEVDSDSFIPLQPENVSPSSDNIELLKSLGLDETQAIHLFKHVHSLKDLCDTEWPDCSEIGISEEKWNELKGSIGNSSELYSPKSFDLPGYKVIDRCRLENAEAFQKSWIKIVGLFPKNAEDIAAMFKFIIKDLDATLTDVMDSVIDLSKSKSEEGLGATTHLLCLLLRNGSQIKDRSPIYERFNSFFLTQFTNENVNKDFFAYGLHIIAQMLSYRDIPDPEVSDFDFGSMEKRPATFNDDQMEEIFASLIQLQNIKDIKSAIGIGKLLLLYSKDSRYTYKITESTLLKELIPLTKIFIDEENNLLEFYQKIMNILLRTCYETKDVLRTLFSAEISQSFDTRTKKATFQMLIDEHCELIIRDQNLFIDVFSDLVRYYNYDGSLRNFSNLTTMLKDDLTKPKSTQNDKTEQKDGEGDIEMESVNDKPPVEYIGTNNTPPSTGVVHLLLTELMEVSKRDWVSTPEDVKEKEANASEKDKKKDNDIVLLMKNSNFAYSCFLLKTITELVGSFKQSKLEFLTFSKKLHPEDKLKPRSTSLNFLTHQLIPTESLIKSSGAEFERRNAISSLAKLSNLALLSTPVIEKDQVADPNKEDADMAVIRKFYVDVLLKNLKEVLALPKTANVRYSKLIDIFNLVGSLLNPKFRELSGPLLSKNATKYDTYFIAKALIDKQVPNQLTSILSELDLNFPQINKIIKSGLKPINYIGKVKTDFQDLFKAGYQGEKDDEDIVPEDVDDRDETPDLFKNSTLGMYDVDFDSEDDEGDYYDDEGPLEVLMSGEEISENESDLDSEMEDEDGLDDGYGDSGLEDIEGDEGTYSNDEDMDDGGIEIIDELDIHSHDEADSDSDDYSDSDGDEFYSQDDNEQDDGHEDVSEYDDDELDGWIEEFEDGDEPSDGSGSEAEDDAGADQGIMRIRRNRNGSIEPTTEDDPADAMSEDDSEIEDDPENSGSLPASRRRARDFATSFFDALRPAMGRTNIASLFGGLFSTANDDYQLLRGSIQIGGERANGIPRFENALDFLLGNRNKNNDDPLSSMYVKSTRERWDDLFEIFFYPLDRKRFLSIAPAIHNRIADESLDLLNKRKDEMETARKERAEKMRKKEEEERERREEEAKKREEEAAAANDNNEPTAHVPVMVRIGDREVDIGGTDIDPEFFEALPDDMREEVFTQHVRERRENATNTGTDAREIDPDFLDALPEQIREEILQQESMARRFSSFEDEMRFNDNEDDEDDEDEDGDIIEPEEIELSPLGVPTSGLSRSSRSENNKKSSKVFFTPLIERPGVASLVKLLFIPQPTTHRDSIHHTLQALCHSKQTRVEVMNLLIGILQDGLHNQRSIEKLYHQITIRASLSSGKHNVSVGNNKSTSSQIPIGATPISIGTQVIEAIHYLLEHNNHLRYYLLTEHENTFVAKHSFNRKNKSKLSLSKEDKYPINYLLKLLDNHTVRDEQVFIDILARVLHIATRPLQILHKPRSSGNPPPFASPVIPDHNYRQLIKILTSNDCPNTTFRRAISAMQSLSILPNAQRVFSIELSDQATSLGNTIISDLKVLTKELADANDYNTESKSFAKFSASSSDQAKLLRILTALDYMFESKEKEKEDKEGQPKPDNESAIVDDEEETPKPAQAFAFRRMSIDEIEELTGLYKRLALGTLWDALSDCLRIMEDKQGMANVSTALLPLIEALMVVCKHSKVKEIQIKDVVKFEAKKIDFTKEPIESLFFSFTDEHKKILNYMVRTNPNLMSGPFGMLVRNPRVLEFDNKKNFFDRQLHQNKNANNKLAINIRRDQVFLDSYRALFFKSRDEFRDSKLDINFKGESGIDAGGVTREWYQVLSRQMFNPDYALFTPVASDETTFHPNRTSYINPEHLSFFKFIGRIIGKAIYDGSYLDCHFSRAVYKRILGKQVSLKDMENLDLEYFKSLMWMLENDITDVITEDFLVETDDYGEHKIIDLVPNGRNIPVTEENKNDYVKLVVEYRLTTSVSEQMDNFISGFHEIIPKDLVSIFGEQELELLISGLPDINVDDWKNNTTYNNYSPSSIQIQWFWRAIKSFDNEERAKLLQFATGTSKVPLNGFKELSGANGTCKFSIHRDYGSTDRLPSSHTCFNQIDLPAYESYETLRGSLLLAFTEGHEGFGLA